MTTNGIRIFNGRENGDDGGLKLAKLNEKANLPIGEFREDLPTYTREDVAKHATQETRIWMSFKEAVYDLTDYMDKHPGGRKIYDGAGLGVEKYFDKYPVHYNPPVLAEMETYRIGNLAKEDVAVSQVDDMFANEPKRHGSMNIFVKKPFNGGPPTRVLVDRFITPNPLFYVRNHSPVPIIDPDTFQLEITGIGVTHTILKLDEIKTKYEKQTIIAVAMCAGNRRTEMAKIKPTPGVQWTHNGVSNAWWGGARLCDVLSEAGLKRNTPGAKHVLFQGMDAEDNEPYECSVPLYVAMDPERDVLLVYEMNEEPLPRDHGFPLRVIMPGIVAARYVKWLNKIIISSEESKNHAQAEDNKVSAPNVEMKDVDYSKIPAMQEMPVSSAICRPGNGDFVKLKDGKLVLKGYAWSGGGQEIIRVDVTVDGGHTWQSAKFTHKDYNQPPKCWSWTLWRAEVPINPGTKVVEAWSKAVDSFSNTQPESFVNIWNARGSGCNAYHRVKINILNA